MQGVTWYATERKEVRFNFPSSFVFELTAQRLTVEAVGNRGLAICTPYSQVGWTEKGI